jgi:6-phosphogluconolactonase (cycloisomerase 2 family)
MSSRGPVPSRQDAPHPHEALLDPTGGFLLLPDLGADIIRIYSVAQNTGLVTSCANYTAAPGTGPRHGSFFVPNAGSTAGTTLYIGNELSNTISSFAVTYTGNCLSLALTKTIAPYPNGQIPAATTRNGVKVGEVRVAGNTLLTSNRADNSFGSNLDSIAQFDINPSTGEFTFNKITSAFGSYPRTFVVNKAGTFVAIGNQNSGTVAIVKRDPVTGALGQLVASTSVGSTGSDGNGGMNSVTWME